MDKYYINDVINLLKPYILKKGFIIDQVKYHKNNTFNIKIYNDNDLYIYLLKFKLPNFENLDNLENIKMAQVIWLLNEINKIDKNDVTFWYVTDKNTTYKRVEFKEVYKC